jgi:hypothetical protein
MQLLRGDPDLRPQPELEAVGEPGGRVHHHSGGVDLVDEPAGGGHVLGDDGLGVPGDCPGGDQNAVPLRLDPSHFPGDLGQLPGRRPALIVDETGRSDLDHQPADRGDGSAHRGSG